MSKSKTELKEVATANDVLANKIYELRGQKVMLHSDLAELYGLNPCSLFAICEQKTNSLSLFYEKS
ncbi:ORF6N domain-containing protein [Sphingobacterium micropteri]|uniref:ORF6N domain-containing protein n=1 Tax=Sphingobacterium micropteri TaxID=2763501 RepID=UPI001CC2AC5D|nr:ORF6N domain-containing protein [Sphingobacterium micropteri]